MKIIKILFTMFFLLFGLNMTFADEEEENPVTIKYIQRVEGDDSGKLRIYIDNLGTSPSNHIIYIDGKKREDVDFHLTEDYIELQNFYQKNGRVKVEKTKIVYEDGEAVLETDSKTDEIYFRGLDEIYFLGNYKKESSSFGDVYLLPLNTQIGYDDFEKRNFEITVNSKEYTLDRYANSLEKGEYYIGDSYVRIPVANLTKKINVIALKVDDEFSNYLVINKEKNYLSQVDIEEDLEDTELLSLKIEMSEDFSDTKEVYINDSKADEEEFLTVGSNLIIKVDLSEKTSDALEIYVKDTNDYMYSNTVFFNLKKYIYPEITGIDFGKNYGKYNNFDFGIIGDGFYGLLSEYDIVLNGVSYSLYGEKEYIEDENGDIEEDINGNEEYKMINKISLKRDGDNLSFGYFMDNLEDENALYIRNNNYDTTSNKISFSRDLENIDYNIEVDNEEQIEEVVFTIGEDIGKDIDFVYDQEPFEMGSVEFQNLINNSIYNISFDISTNREINSFSYIEIDDETLSPEKQDDGTYIYEYDLKDYGKNFKNSDIVLNLNQSFNTEDEIIFKFSNIKIDKLNNSSLFENISTDDEEKEDFVFLNYNYFVSNCFDGEKGDYCNENDDLLGGDSKLEIKITFFKNEEEGTEDIREETQENSTDEEKVENTSEEKDKYLLEKQLIRSELIKETENKKYVVQIDLLIEKINKEKASKVIGRLEKLNTENLPFNIKQILSYLEISLFLVTFD